MGLKIWKFEIKIPKWLEKPAEVKARPMEPKPPRETRARKQVSSRVKDFFRKTFRPNKKDIQELRWSFGADYKKAKTVKDKIKVAGRAAAAKQYDLASGLYAKTARYILRQSGGYNKGNRRLLNQILDKMRNLCRKNPDNKFLKNNYDKTENQMVGEIGTAINVYIEDPKKEQIRSEIMQNSKPLKESLTEKFKGTRDSTVKLQVAAISQDLCQYEMAAGFYKALAYEMLSDYSGNSCMILTMIYRDLYVAVQRKNCSDYLKAALKEIENNIRDCKEERFAQFIKTAVNELFRMDIKKFNF